VAPWRGKSNSQEGKIIMHIQDDLNGALLISAIDFVLSFVIIGGIGCLLALFPLLNKVGKLDDETLKSHH
jgi:hypothetical protein